jgi:hypothetical protein
MDLGQLPSFSTKVLFPFWDLYEDHLPSRHDKKFDGR